MGFYPKEEEESLNIESFRFDSAVRTVSTWFVKRVVSPYEFYLEIELDPLIGDGKFAQDNYQNWYPKMQEFYNHPKNQRLYELKCRHDIVEGCCYVHRNLTDKNEITWHRVRALNVLNCTIKVFYCDLGRVECTHYNDLYNIAPEHAKRPSQLIRGYLYDILPPTYKTTGLQWSVEACVFLRNAMSCPTGELLRLRGVMLAKSKQVAKDGFPDIVYETGVALWEHQLTGTDPSCTLNAILVKEGFAISTGMFSCCTHQLEHSEVILKKEEFKRNQATEEDKSYQESQDVEGTDEYGDNGKLWVSDDYRKYLDWKKAKQQENEEKNNPQMAKVDNWLPAEARKNLAHVKIVYCKGPGHVIIHFVNDLNLIMEMENRISQSIDINDPVNHIEIGSFVAFGMERMEEERQKKSPQTKMKFYRGFVKSQASENAYNILAIDYGNEVVILKHYIFNLAEYFLTIPNFALRVHLDIPGLIPVRNGDKWSNLANHQLQKYLLSWAPTNPMYFLQRTPGRKWIEFDTIQQEIAFNREAQSWIPDPSPMGNGDNDLLIPGDPTGQHLLKSLMRSIGVKISYEIATSSGYWFFGDLHDDLRLRGDVENKLTEDTMIRNPLAYNVWGTTWDSWHW